jgi:hypothetical protein
MVDTNRRGDVRASAENILKALSSARLRNKPEYGEQSFEDDGPEDSLEVRISA